MPKTRDSSSTPFCTWKTPWLEKVLLFLGLLHSHGFVCCCPGKSWCCEGLMFSCADVPLRLFWKDGFILG